MCYYEEMFGSFSSILEVHEGVSPALEGGGIGVDGKGPAWFNPRRTLKPSGGKTPETGGFIL